MEDTDLELLRRFATTGDEAPFYLLARRHMGMVYGVALRGTEDASLAEEVTQTVFAILARKARALRHENLSGWLHTTACHEARNAWRKALRYRKTLEQFRRLQSMKNSTSDTDPTDKILPWLDKALASLRAEERSMVVMYYLESRSIRDIASATGKSEDASRKAVQRAIERISAILQKRGVLSPAASLTALLSAQVLSPAPAAGAAALTAQALQAAPLLKFSTLFTHAIYAMKVTTTHKAVAAVLILAAVPIGILWNQNSQLEAELESLASLQKRESMAGSRAGANERYVPSTASPQKEPAKKAAETPAANRDEAAAQMGRALRTHDPILRQRRFLDILALMTPENGQIYYDGWMKYTSDNRAPAAQVPMFNRRIGQVFGKVVMGNRKGTESEINGARSGGAMRDQFLGWMDTEPAAAKSWLNGLTNESFREALIGSWLESVANQNPAAAVAWLSTVPKDLQGRYVHQMVDSLRELKSAPEMGAWFAGLASENAETRNAPWLRTAWDRLMWSVTATKGPGPEAAPLFEQHAGQPYVDGAWGRRIAGKYVVTDPVNGVAWTLRMADRPEAKDSKAILSSAAAALPPDKLPAAVASCQDAADSPSRDTLLGMLATRLNETAPAAAAAVIEKIKDPARRPVLPAAESW